MSRCTSATAYGPHLYPPASADSASVRRAIDADVQRIVAFQRSAKVPYYVGELHVNANAAGAEEQAREQLAYLLKSLNELGISWTKWTWKGVDTGDWACVNLGRDVCVDLAHDSVERIEQVWQRVRSSESGVRNAPLCAALAQGFQR